MSGQKITNYPNANRVPVQSCQTNQSNKCNKYSIAIDFKNVAGMSDLTGSVDIDWKKSKKYTISVDGMLSDCFANLAGVRVKPDTTISLSQKTEILYNGQKDILLEASVPLRVNNIIIDRPIGKLGYNFREPEIDELPVGLMPVTPIAGTAAKGGDIMFAVSLDNVNFASLFDICGIDYDSNKTEVDLQTSSITVKSNTKAISVQAEQTTQSIDIDFRTDPKITNILATNDDGVLVEVKVPNIDTSVNTNISALDNNLTAQKYPIGGIAVWSNINASHSLIIRTSDTGMNQWSLVGNNASTKLVGDVDGTVNSNSVKRIQGVPVLEGVPEDKHMLIYNATNERYEPGITEETVTSIAINENTLTYTDEAGVANYIAIPEPGYRPLLFAQQSGDFTLPDTSIYNLFKFTGGSTRAFTGSANIVLPLDKEVGDSVIISFAGTAIPDNVQIKILDRDAQGTLQEIFVVTESKDYEYVVFPDMKWTRIR